MTTMLFTEITAIYSQNHWKPTVTDCYSAQYLSLLQVLKGQLLKLPGDVKT